jgi:hypothetical protein
MQKILAYISLFLFPILSNAQTNTSFKTIRLNKYPLPQSYRHIIELREEIKNGYSFRHGLDLSSIPSSGPAIVLFELVYLSGTSKSCSYINVARSNREKTELDRRQSFSAIVIRGYYAFLPLEYFNLEGDYKIRFFTLFFFPEYENGPVATKWYYITSYRYNYGVAFQ